MKIKQMFFIILLKLFLKINVTYGSDVRYVCNFNITTHILDTSKGEPARNVNVSLFKLTNNEKWINIDNGRTGINGRYDKFASNTTIFTSDVYKLHFEIKEYYNSTNQKTIFPFIDVVFHVDDPKEHYHIPLLLNPYGYTTYRGS